MITRHLHLVSADARAAWERITTEGRPTTTEPNVKVDPMAWAAWQAWRTSNGIHGENATRNLFAISTEARTVFSEIFNLIEACRTALREGRVTFTVEETSK